MESIKEILEKRIKPEGTSSLEKDSKEKSYIDQETGLKYCLNCKTPLEKEMDFLGERKKVSIPCRCKEERRKEEEKERKKIKRMLLIDGLKRECFDDPILLNWNFKNMDNDSEHETIAKNYVEKFDEIFKNNVGLILTGDVGCGKTYLASAIANALLEKDISVKMTNFSVILNDMTNFEIDKSKYIDNLNRKKLLIIDDFGMERDTAFAAEHIFNIIDSRYRSGKPLIITTNLNISALTNPESTKDKRIYSRILEICSPIIFTGGNRRINKMKEKSKLAYELLKTNESR
ncbi:MAG: ATP-binding protein [Tissierellia bacterium]|nr:ATP-binding protein [Tissierellia bacterium]